MSLKALITMAQSTMLCGHCNVGANIIFDPCPFGSHKSTMQFSAQFNTTAER